MVVVKDTGSSRLYWKAQGRDRGPAQRGPHASHHYCSALSSTSSFSVVFILILNSAFDEYFRILTFLCMTTWQGVCIKCTRFSCHFRSHAISPGIVLNLPHLTFDSCVLPICLFVTNSELTLPATNSYNQIPITPASHRQWSRSSTMSQFLRETGHTADHLLMRRH